MGIIISCDIPYSSDLKEVFKVKPYLGGLNMYTCLVSRVDSYENKCVVTGISELTKFVLLAERY